MSGKSGSREIIGSVGDERREGVDSALEAEEDVGVGRVGEPAEGNL